MTAAPQALVDKITKKIQEKFTASGFQDFPDEPVRLFSYLWFSNPVQVLTLMELLPVVETQF
jgi:hypothetical protein